MLGVSMLRSRVPKAARTGSSASNARTVSTFLEESQRGMLASLWRHLYVVPRVLASMGWWRFKVWRTSQGGLS